MSYEDNEVLLASARRIEDILESLEIDKILPKRYHQGHNSSEVLNLAEESLNYSNGAYNLYPLMYNLSLSIEDYSNESKPLYKAGDILYIVDPKRVKFFYEKTENKLSNPSAIYNVENKQVKFNASVINSMEEESLRRMLKFISILNYITYFKKYD